MASFYGRQQTTDKGTAQASAAVATASPSACLKSCEKVMNQCLVDATTFMEKERCRDRYDICSVKCGATENPLVTKAATATPETQGLFGAATPTATPPECSDNSRCVALHGPGWYCNDGKCEKTGTPICQTDANCPTNYVCINGQCVKRTNPSTCKVNNDCLPGYVCDGRICVRATPCKTNEDCPFGEGCKNGICQPIPNIKPCNNITNPCKTGYKCLNGDCVPIVPPPSACVEGATCTDSTQCAGKPCVNGKCQCTPPTPGGECTPGKKCTGPEKNNSQCGGLKCFRPKFKGDETVPGTCYCNVGPGQEEKKKGTTGDGTLGEYQWPSEMTDLYGRLMGKAGDYLDVDLPNYNLPPELQTLLDSLLGRAGEYMARKPGYSQSALEAQFGKGYENIRNLGTLARQQTETGLQREGMLGTGAGQAALRQIPWQTEKNISDVVRDVFLGNEEQKRKDLESFTNISSGLFGQGVGVEQMVEAINAERRGEERDYTGIANQLFGTGMTYNQLQEAINASRRGEGQNALAMWMQYIMSLMSSWKS